MDPPVYRLPSDILEQIIFELDLQCGVSDRAYRAILAKCLRVSRRWYREFKPHLWASLSINRRTHVQLQEFIPANRPLVRDLVIDMNGSAVHNYDSGPFLASNFYEGILMRHMFEPGSPPPPQDSLNTEELVGRGGGGEDITKRIMQSWLKSQSIGWSTWPPPRPTLSPIFFQNLETFQLSNICFRGQSNGRYLRLILEGLPLLRHLRLHSVKNVLLVTHNLVLNRIQSLSLYDVDNTNMDLLRLLSVRCTPYVDRVKLDLIKIPRAHSLNLLDTLLEHGNSPTQRLHCKDSLPIRHLDGLDCRRFYDDDLATFFENLPTLSLRTVSIARGIGFKSGAMMSLIRNHGPVLQTLYLDGECNLPNEALQAVVTQLPNLRLLGLLFDQASDRLIMQTDLTEPWACNQLKRLKLHEGPRHWLTEQNLVLANLEYHHEVITVSSDSGKATLKGNRRVLRRGTGTAAMGSQTAPPPQPLGDMELRELRFLEILAGLEKLQDLQISRTVWADEEARSINIRLERRYGVHGPLGRGRGVVRRTIENPDRGSEYQFYGWKSVQAQ
ncbi:hypothetical protein BG004_007439 [Podila humilis]|nr:hypothetical protein BG004_007439 [Podila humilis]